MGTTPRKPSRWASVDFPADAMTPTVDEYTHTLVPATKPNPQIAMNLYKALRRFLALPFTQDEYLAMTDASYLVSLRAERERLARLEAVAKANGGHVCERCGGHGGHAQWPGWTCYGCDGRGWAA